MEDERLRSGVGVYSIYSLLITYVDKDTNLTYFVANSAYLGEIGTCFKIYSISLYYKFQIKCQFIRDKPN